MIMRFALYALCEYDFVKFNLIFREEALSQRSNDGVMMKLWLKQSEY